MTNIYIWLMLFCSSSYTYAHSSCDQMVAFGYPSGIATDTTDLCRIAYFVKYSTTTKDPVYSAEYLLKSNISIHIARVNAFKADPALPPGNRAELTEIGRASCRERVCVPV